MRQLFLLAAALGVLSLGGCADYCETWDGEHCALWGDYWSATFLTAVPLTKQTAGKPLRLANVAGDWEFNLAVSENSCPVDLETLTANVYITQSRRRVTMAVPRFGTFTGRRNRKGMHVTGSYPMSIPICQAEVKADLIKLAPRRWAAELDAQVNCGKFWQCNLTADGKATRS